MSVADRFLLRLSVTGVERPGSSEPNKPLAFLTPGEVEEAMPRFIPIRNRVEGAGGIDRAQDVQRRFLSHFPGFDDLSVGRPGNR